VLQIFGEKTLNRRTGSDLAGSLHSTSGGSGLNIPLSIGPFSDSAQNPALPVVDEMTLNRRTGSGSDLAGSLHSTSGCSGLSIPLYIGRLVIRRKIRRYQSLMK